MLLILSGHPVKYRLPYNYNIKGRYFDAGDKQEDFYQQQDYKTVHLIRKHFAE